MAEDLNNLFQNFENKSLEELGSSLLARKADINRQNQKQAKKSRRIGQALALMGAGQSIFKNALDKRLNELDEKGTLILGNQKNQAATINNVSRIVKFFPDEDWFNQEKYKGLSSDALAQKFMEEESGAVEGIRANLAPVIKTIIQPQFQDEGEYVKFSQSGDYDRVITTAADTLVKEYFKEGKNFEKDGKRLYQNFETELTDLLNLQNADRQNVFLRGIGLKPDELTTAEKAMLRRFASKYEGKNFRDGFKDMLKRAGRIQEEKGSYNLFKNIDKVITDDKYLLTETLNKMDIAGHLIGNIDDSMAAYRNNNNQYKYKFAGNEDLQADVAMDMQAFYKTSQKFNTGRISPRKKELRYDPNHIIRVAGDDDVIENYLGDFIDNPDDINFIALQKDAGQLSMAFKDDVNFATRAYIDSLSKRTEIQGAARGFFYTNPISTLGQELIGEDRIAPIELSNEKIADFKAKIINDDSFRNKFAIALLVRNGILNGGPFSSESYAFDTEGKIYEKYQDPEKRKYDTNDSPLAAILGRGIEYDIDNSKFIVNEDWENMNTRNRRGSFDTHTLQILKAPEVDISTDNKLNAVNQLFMSDFNPYRGQYSNTIEYLQDKPMFVNFLNLFNVAE